MKGNSTRFFIGRTIKWVLASLLCLLIVKACKVDDELTKLKKTPWSPELAVPLVNANISVADALSMDKPEAVTYDEEDVLTLTYQSELYSISGKELVSLADQWLNIAAGFNRYGFELHPSFILQFLKLAGGELNIDLEGPGRGQVDVRLDIDALRIAGAPFSQTWEGVDRIEDKIDLADAELEFSRGAENRIDIEFIVLDENGVNVTSEYQLFLRFRSMAISLAKGWFDQVLIDFEKDTIELDVFEHWKSGRVFLDDPRIHIDLQNSIGIPFYGSISTLDVSQAGTGSTVIPINYSMALGDSFIVAYPSAEEIEGIVNSVYTLDKLNSNIQNVIEISPDQLSYDFRFVAHHDYNLDEPGFISDTSRLVVATDLSLPFAGRIEDVVLRDTIDLTIDLGNETEPVEGATIEITTNNAIPVGLQLQLMFLDEQGLVLDSLFDQGTFLSAPMVDQRGRVSASAQADNSISINQEKFERIQHAKSVAIYGKLRSSNGAQTTVRFQSTNFLGIQLRMRLKYRVQ